MSLLHPELLWLLPLAGLPILLHLLTLHRLKTVELSTFRFLFDSYVQQRRRMQFLEALLAMLRTLFLLGLVFLFCRLSMSYWSSLFQAGSGGREIILLVDCSASMNATTGGKTALDRAKAAALTIVDKLGPEDRLTLVRVGAKPEELFSRFAQDANVIRDRIESLKPGPSRANFFAALSQLFGPGKPPRVNPLVYVFTDCQATGWREVREQGLGKLIPDGTAMTVVNFGARDAVANVAVVGNAPRNNRVIAGLPIILQPRVVNFSKTEPAEVTLSVLIDEMDDKDGSHTMQKEIDRTRLTLKPGETKTHKVVYVPAEPGNLRCRFEITAKNPDYFPDDDRFLFTLSVVPRLKVLLVNGNPAAADPFDNECLYLRTALTAPLEESQAAKALTALAGNKESLRSLDVQEIPEGAVTPQFLEDASVVILCNCGTLNGQHFLWLRKYVAEGGGLLIFPGERVNPEIYNTQFFLAPEFSQGEKLIAAQLKAPEGDLDKAETFERLAAIEFAHPVLSVFDDPEARYLRTAHFGRRFPLQFAEKRENTWTLAEFSRGPPALVESRFHDGLVLLAAFPANSKWTNLTLKPEFVPLVLRLVSYLEHRPALEVTGAVPADGAAEISVAGGWVPVAGQVTDSSGRASELKDFERSGSRILSAFERTTERDYYTVEVKGGSTQPPRTASATFAVNLAPEESDFATVNQAQLQELVPAARLTLLDASAEAQQIFGAIGSEPEELWRPLIYLLFAIITVEFLLATFHGPKKETDENLTMTERIRQYSPGTWVGRMTGSH
jgi:hypothetical protein